MSNFLRRVDHITTTVNCSFSPQDYVKTPFKCLPFFLLKLIPMVYCFSGRFLFATFTKFEYNGYQTHSSSHIIFVLHSYIILNCSLCYCVGFRISTAVKVELFQTTAKIYPYKALAINKYMIIRKGNFMTCYIYRRVYLSIR